MKIKPTYQQMHCSCCNFLSHNLASRHSVGVMDFLFCKDKGKVSREITLYIIIGKPFPKPTLKENLHPFQLDFTKSDIKKLNNMKKYAI